MTVSLGCSTLLPGESMDSLLRRADSALYVSKREGRNRLSMAG
jgi:PleD family two-component response regulator